MEKSYFYQMLKDRRAPGREFLIHLSFLLNLIQRQQITKNDTEHTNIYVKKATFMQSDWKNCLVMVFFGGV